MLQCSQAAELSTDVLGGAETEGGHSDPVLHIVFCVCRFGDSPVSRVPVTVVCSPCISHKRALLRREYTDSIFRAISDVGYCSVMLVTHEVTRELNYTCAQEYAYVEFSFSVYNSTRFITIKVQKFIVIVIIIIIIISRN